jgi:hypothetical protein
MQKIVFFDIDGTLMTRKNLLPESTKQAIKELKEKGHLPIIATGRPPEMLAAVAEELKIDNFISLNGQYIVIHGEAIYSKPLPTDALEKLIEASYEQGDRTFLLTEKEVIGNTFMGEMMDPDFLTYVYTHLTELPTEVTLELFKHMTEKPLPRERYENKEILMAFVNTSEENDAYYQEHFPELHFTRATPLIGEAIMKGSHKAVGMARVLNHLDKNMADTIAFGDSLNDIEMLETAGIGVAMGNGREELKNAADYITADVEEDGIYKGLKRLELI